MNKKMDNKGFSLVELIIVIAIMVILVGALAPQFFKYIEKSRQATDVQTAGTVYTVLVTALSDPDVGDPTLTGGKYSLPTSDGAAGSFDHEVWESLGEKTPTLQSRAYKTHSWDNIVIDGSDVTITLTSSDSNVPSKKIDASGSSDATTSTP